MLKLLLSTCCCFLFSIVERSFIVARQSTLMYITAIVIVFLQIWFKNRRAKFRKEKRTPILHGKKDYSIKDSASPVSPTFCPANSPIFSTQGNTATTMEKIQGNRMLALPSISTLPAQTSAWKSVLKNVDDL